MVMRLASTFVRCQAIGQVRSTPQRFLTSHVIASDVAKVVSPSVSPLHCHPHRLTLASSTPRRTLAYRLPAMPDHASSKDNEAVRGPDPQVSPPVVKMVVLETDEPHPDDHHEKGSLGEILHGHFVRAGQAHDPKLGIETDQVFVVKEKGGRIPTIQEFEGVRGVLITGSMYDAHGDEEWIQELLVLLKELWTTRPDMHFSGVCFGHQLISRLLGAEIEATGQWELGHSRIDLTPIGQKLFRTEDDHIHLHQMHQDRVVSPPSEKSTELLTAGDQVHVWGKSPHTEVQGLYVRNRVFTTQAHMAFDQKMVKREMQMRVESGGISEEHEEERKKAVETSHLDHDGSVVASAILRFFHFEDDGLD